MTSSPCIKSCVIDPLSGLCIGCGRTVGEISSWRDMDEPERLAVMAALPERMRSSRSRAARSGRVRAPNYDAPRA